MLGSVIRGAVVACLPLFAFPACAGEADLWAALRSGGKVMLVRHADAPGGAGDPAGFRLDDCTTQRNLSDPGRAEARALGARIRAQGIAAGRVVTSQWCRCRETAALMALGEIEEAPALNNAYVLRDRRESLAAAGRALVAGWSGPGTLVAVTHGANILALTGIHPRQGEIVVVEPQPHLPDRLRVLGRIPPS